MLLANKFNRCFETFPSALTTWFVDLEAIKMIVKKFFYHSYLDQNCLIPKYVFYSLIPFN